MNHARGHTGAGAVNAVLRWAEIVGFGGGAVGLVLTSAFLAVPRTRHSVARDKQVL